MDFKDVIHKRRSVRDFKDTEVPLALLLKAIEIGFNAPTYNHLKEWHFLIVDSAKKKEELVCTEKMYDKVSEEMELAFESIDDAAKAMYLEAIPKQKRMLLQAPYVVVVVFKPKTPVQEAEKIYDLNCLASVWCCIENFLLALAEEDIFGVTFISQNTPDVKRVLEIPPQYEIAALIPVGYKKDDAVLPKHKHVPLSERVHRNRWPDFFPR